MTDANILVNHAYTLLEAREVPEGIGEKVKLLKLRNPWGMREWSGPWSDGSDEWKTKAGQKAKADLQYVEADDGTFYISWDDFQACFNSLPRRVPRLLSRPPPALPPSSPAHSPPRPPSPLPLAPPLPSLPGAL